MIWKAWRQETIPILGMVLAWVGLFSGHLTILIAGLFFWGLAFLSSYLARRTLESISVSTWLGEQYAEIGETVPTEMVVQNPAPWPILDMQWKVELPQAVDPHGPGTILLTPGSARQTLAGTVWAAGRQRVRVQYGLIGHERGRWNIGPASLTFRDPLSWNELVREERRQYHLTIWPRRYGLPSAFWSQNPESGTIRGNPWDPPDPFRIIGTRPYHPGDPVRQIAPHACARMGRLMIKQLEPMSDRSVEVLLHPKTTEAHWQGIDRDLLEETISVAATVVEASVNRGSVTGLSSTGAISGHIRGYTLAAERRAHAGELLTALAWTQPSGTMDDDLPHVLSRLERRLADRATLVFVSPYWPQTLTEQLHHHVLGGLHVIYLAPGDRKRSLPPWLKDIWYFSHEEWSRA